MRQTIKGYIPKKIPPKTPEDILLENVGKYSALITELTDFKNNISSEVDSKFDDIESAIGNATEIIERTKDEAIEVIKEIKQGEKGDPGEDADPVDTEEIVQEILSRLEIPEPIPGKDADEESILKKLTERIPKPVDEDKLLSRFLKKIPEKKGSLKIIQEKVEFDPMSVIDEIMKPESKFKIKASQIDGLQQTFSAFHTQLGRGYLHGGGLSTVSHDATLTGLGTPQSPLSVVNSGGGTVTSVNASGGTTGLTFSGGPVTSTGTLTLGGILGTANGGTGFSGTFTQNSVIFAGATGALSQDNSGFNYIAVTGLHVGLAAGTSNSFLAGYGLEVVGSDNTLAGVNLIVGNTNSGTKAFSDIYLQNDLSNGNGLTHFAVLNYSSSTYSDTAFGTLFAQPNQLALYGTDGNTYVGSAAASGYVGFFTGGTSTTNERARITNTQLALGVQATWNTGLGAMTHILGPRDQTLAIVGGVPVQTTTSQNGQAVTVTGGNAIAGTVSGLASGGAVSIAGGIGLAAGGSSGGNGGDVNITGGNTISGSSGANGGSVNISTGNGAGGTVPGNIIITTKANTNGGSTGFIRLITANGVSIGTGTLGAVGGAMQLTTGNAANNGVNQTAAGSLGGPLTLTMGNGGNTTNATTSTAGGGGLWSVVGGTGGNATGAGTNVGGAGSSYTITTGNGGNATGGTTNTGGASGSLTFAIGTPGTGATANGARGTFNFTGSKAIFAASTTTYATTNYPAGTAPTTPVTGDVWNDSTQNMIAFSNGNTLYQAGNLYTATAAVTITSTTPITALSGTKIGTTTIKANTLKVGQKFAIWGAGYYSTPLANTSTVTITVKIGSVTVSTVTTGALPASATNLPFLFNLQFTVRSIGASATLVCDGSFDYNTALSGIVKTSNSLSTVGTVTFDSTVDEAMDVLVSWSAVTTQTATVQQSKIDFL